MHKTGIGPDRIEIAFDGSQIAKPNIHGNRLRQVVNSRLNTASQRTVAGQILVQNRLLGRGYKALFKDGYRLIEPA